MALLGLLGLLLVVVLGLLMLLGPLVFMRWLLRYRCYWCDWGCWCYCCGATGAAGATGIAGVTGATGTAAVTGVLLVCYWCVTGAVLPDRPQAPSAPVPSPQGRGGGGGSGEAPGRVPAPFPVPGALCGGGAFRPGPMSFYDAFRGFFGLPGGRRPREPLFGGAPRDEDEDEAAEGPPRPPPPPPDGFGFGFGPGGALEELLRDAAELLGAFGGAWAWPPPAIEPPLPGPGPGQPLRDSMLKHPDGPEGSRDPARPWSLLPELEDAPPAPPERREDQDLDSQVSSAGLGTILRPHEPQPRSYFQSVSVTKVTLPDGAVEERRTVQDSHGRRETTITLRRGAQTFVSTTTEDGQGKEHREELLGVDDREPAQFAGTWPPHDELRAPTLSDPSAVLGSFFRRWFSGW
uniref:HCLS1 associated protein X-1 n=1 Tax=Cairina moschata TaxID=8855 RepID=A0A8C3CJV7_CAIMO